MSAVASEYITQRSAADLAAAGSILEAVAEPKADRWYVSVSIGSTYRLLRKHKMKIQPTRRAVQIALTSAVACGAWLGATSYYGIPMSLGNYAVMALGGAALALLLRIFNVWR